MTKIPPHIHEEIMKRLLSAEKEHDVEVLFAIESGSRAWGFESQDSDYDVRFIYKHKREYYLSIEEGRDVIEYPIVDEVDINGWDIKKALQLFQKGNPTFAEWIKSPIVYKETGEFRKEVLELEQQNFSPRNYIFHYLHMAEGNYKEYLKGDTVRTKKYFYVLRPVLACLWVEKHMSAPPMEFDTLYQDCDYITPLLRTEIDALLVRKKAGDELAAGQKIQCINDFLEEYITKIQQKASEYNIKKVETEVIDGIFRKYIG